MYAEDKDGMLIRVRVVGTVQTPFHEASGTPIQAEYGKGIEGRILVNDLFVPALDDIEGFERLWLIYWMDRVGPFRAKVIPYRDNGEHGVLATRSPSRPNPIGISVVRLIRRKGAVLYIKDIDILNGTRIIDIKPYIPEFDSYPVSRAGWFDTPGVDRRRADDRFHKNRRQPVAGGI